ncbi:MAG: class I SAM-dependent methyltransferase [Spirochaetales bacterium]|nr:class I SAM-dependent methyltransferase [Spirochaetales bacterium]
MQHEKHTDHLREIEEYYRPKLKNGVPDFKALGWENKAAHLRRFRTLAKYVNLENRSVLDVGCGFGTFYDYLHEQGMKVRYTGIDILPEMIKRAKDRHKGIEFSCIDLFDESLDFDLRFDVVFASGIFNLNLGNNLEFLKKALVRFFGLANEIIAFNLLHEDSDNREDRYFYTNPVTVTGLLRSFAGQYRDTEYYHSYQKNDFTVIIRK